MSSEATQASFLGESRFRSPLGESLDASRGGVIYFAKLVLSGQDIGYWIGRMFPDSLTVESIVRSPTDITGFGLADIGGSQDAIFGHAGATVFELYPRSFDVFRAVNGVIDEVILTSGGGPPVRDRVTQRVWIGSLTTAVGPGQRYRLSAADFGIEKRFQFDVIGRFRVGGDHTNLFQAVGETDKIGKCDPETLELLFEVPAPGPFSIGIGGGRDACYLVDRKARTTYVLDPRTLEILYSRVSDIFADFTGMGGE